MTRSAIIVASSDQVVDAAAEAFAAGGNVIDAAVAAGFATCAGDPAITSLAGGGALVHRDAATGRVDVCDFFANAPALGSGRAIIEGFTDDHDFRRILIDFGAAEASQPFYIGRGAAAVPGTLPGLIELWRQRGSLPLGELVAPTVTLLRDGFSLSEFQVDCIRVLAQLISHSAELHPLILDGSGDLVDVGSRFRNPRLADFLARLRDCPEAEIDQFVRDAFQAPILQAFGESHGGLLDEADLRSYRPEWRQPLEFEFSGARVCSNPPPSFGGPSIRHTLALFERCRIGSTRPGTRDRYATLAAVFRAISEVRSERHEIFDAPDAAVAFSSRLDGILASNGGASTSREPHKPGSTTHISIIDDAGNAVTTTMSHGEGNGFEVPGTGMMMNNFLGEEDLFPGGFGHFAPGRRLSTMMAPTVVEHGDGAVTVLGSGGSNRIRTAISQVICNLVDDGLEPAESLRQARIHFESGTLSSEAFLLDDPDDALEGARQLSAKEHVFDGPNLFFGGVHVAHRTAQGELEAGGDFRRGGHVRRVEG